MTPSPDVSPRVLEHLETRVLEQLVSGASPAERTALGLGLTPLADGALMTLGRFGMVRDFNRTLGLGTSQAVTDGVLDQLQALGRAAGLGQVMVGVVPGAQGGLRERLLERGATPVRAWLQLWREAAAMEHAPSGLDIRALQDDETETFIDVVMRGFGMPPDLRPLGTAVIGQPDWRHYLAWDGPEPVASASLFLSGGYGWLGNAATLPQWRRRGAQLALIARRVTDAALAGAHTVFTQVAEELPEQPNPSEHNMRRAEFQTAYRREHLILPTAPP